MRAFRWHLVLLFLSGLGCSALAAQATLLLHVVDIQGRPVQGLVIKAQLLGSAITDISGAARIPLPNSVKPGDWTTVSTSSDSAKNYVLVSPLDGRVLIPASESESTAFVSLVVVLRGDRALLANGGALSGIAAKITKDTSLAQTDQDEASQRQIALRGVAQSLGLEPAEIDKAIRAWAKNKAADPYEKGVVALYAKNYPEATAELERSRDSLETQVEAQKRSLFDSSINLGKVLYGSGDYAKAAESFKRANELIPDQTSLLEAWALNCMAQGDYNLAESLLNKALLILTKSQGNDSERAVILTGLGQVEYQRRDLDSAEAFIQKALAIRKTILGPEDPLVADSLEDLALLLEDKAEYSEAKPLFRRSLAIREKVLGPDHPLVADSLNNLAELLMEERRIDEAEPLLLRALTIQEKALGPDHLGVASSLSNLAQVLIAKGDYDGAERLLDRSLAIRQKALGRNHPSVADSLVSLGRLLCATGRCVEGRNLYLQALNILENTLGSNAPKTVYVRKLLDSPKG